MPSLRTALVVDAVLTVLSAPLLLLVPSTLAPLVGSTPAAVRGVGAFLVVWALWFVVVLRDDEPRRGPVRVVLVVNTLWVVAGAALAAGAFGEPTPVGVGLLVLQAGVVAALTVVQVVAARRPLPARAAVAAG